MAIAKARIEHIKKSVDLVALVTSRGIELKKNGKGYMGLCPFHDDTHPSFSVSPDKNLWQCFGCGAAGDVIRFVELFDKVPFTRAVKQLSDDNSPVPRRKTPPQKQQDPSFSVSDQKLMARVVAYYQHTLTGDDTRGLDYLKNERGINDIQSLKDFGAGFANGTLRKILPQDPQVIDALKSIGVLNKNGNEMFYNCVVFALLDARGAAVGLYGRRIKPPGGEARHLYMSGPRFGLINRQAVKRSQTLLLTESIIDALTLYDQGFKNVMPIYGLNGLRDEHLSFFDRKVKTAYLVFDADEPGRAAVKKVAAQLKEKKIVSWPVTLPVKDVNVYFKRHTPEEFEQLLKQANPKSLAQSDKISKRKQSLYKATEQGFIVGYGESRQYEVKAIQRGGTQLKVTLKASTDIASSNRPFELTTIDLYSSRSRLWFAKLCADLLEASAELVKEDIGRILTLVEQYKPRARQVKAHEPTAAEKDAALKFLKNPNLFDEILADLEALGVVGETTNKIVSYLAAVSRKLSKPLSVLVQSRSSAGKSTLQNAILNLVPDEDYEKYTRVTDQALFYKEEDSLVHKILAIEEDAGVGGAAYSIRNIQSAGKITVAATGKDPGTGKMKTEQYTVKGPVTVMLTTTAAELDQETASRFISLSIDESAAMTRAIHAKQRQARTLEGLINRRRSDGIVNKHHNAHRLLRPVAVVNNFDKYLTYPDGNLITRRDHDKYLGLMDAIAYLKQYQRKTKTVNVDGEPVEYVEVTLEDIDLANKLANEVLGQSLDELAKPSRTLLSAVFKMVRQLADKDQVPIDHISFNRRQIREYIGWTDWQIKVHIKQLEELEYLYVQVGTRGKQYSYALNYHGQGEDNSRCYLNLTPVEEIKKLIKKDKDKN